MVSTGSLSLWIGENTGKMDNGIIQCPRCDTDNPVESDICYICGEPLHAEHPEKAGKHRLIGLLIVLTIAIGAFSFYFLIVKESPPKIAAEAVAPVSSPLQKEKADLPVLPEPLPTKKLAQIQPLTPEKGVLSTGLVVIKDIAEKPITRITAPIVAGVWVALPRQPCLGGYQWSLQMDSGNELSIVDGIIGEGESLGLWRLQVDEPLKGPGLHPWSSGKALSWVSLQPDAAPQPVKISSVIKQAHFAKATPAASINGPGVFIQNDQVVGWTFGDIMDGAYLWIGEPGVNLEAEIRVDDFYRATFANSREEELTLALALGDSYTQIERLAAMVNSFRFDPKLSADDTPAHLQPGPVVSKIRALTAQSVQDGNVFEIANIFDAQILILIADIDLVAEVLHATVEGYDFEEATELAGDIADRIALTDSQDKTRLAELRSGLYRSWITGMIDQGDIQNGWHAYELGSQRLPNDLRIHLLGVRLALAENDWATAERFLAMKDYPLSLSDQVRLLQAQISELKGQEGKIVIEFAPGSRAIQVAATLNNSIEQQFLVDTGASTVTIPSSTAESLGLTSGNNPLRRVTTASGIIEAPEVVLPSITVNDYEVDDVTALVIDIPNQPDLGLLGLSFLDRFRVDLNVEKGVLILEPR
jgi:clan AA aspartic protease (TIGR02281 family)